MNKEFSIEELYELVVYIGRFEPFHVAHQKTVERALELADNVLVLVGSCNGPRTIKNPWNFNERRHMIEICFPEYNDSIALHVKGIKDYTYDDNAWIRNVGSIVNNLIRDKGIDPSKVAVIGNDKDSSSFYLNYFPQWKFIEEPLYPPHGDSIDATKIRQLMFNNDFEFTRGVLPEPVYDYLMNGIEDRSFPDAKGFIFSDEFETLKKEWKFVEDYKASWASAPYAPTFVTVDGVVIQSGHILLIQRGEFPGQGLWALPGGFVDPGERIKHAVLRELKEETGLKVPEKVMNRAIDHTDVFDNPARSTRGRTITHAFRFTLDPTQSLPKVKGGDDAKHAQWIPLGDLDSMESVMYEDHFHIIKHMLAAK